ncbi:trypsin-like serine protease [Frigoribacterium sp. MEB024]|uniref:S1 family peptidase n=1 Tax=Frigoribacterium sp. MEB024 TaxID=1589899 RepID=UPI0005BC4CA8|nr:S1 family peptidase [Frigoribacterium sp. MEB024]
MKKFVAAALTAAALAVGSLGVSTSAVAAGPDNTIRSTDIVGGQKAPTTPWAVQLVFRTGGTASYACTGEQINASWVLTARHCIDGVTSMQVYHSNSTTNPGTAIAVDRVAAAPVGDIALVHLSQSKTLGSYPSLNLGFQATSSGTGTIMGYGLRANSVQSDGLYQATVGLTGRSTDAYGGVAQHLNGTTGAANHGDSGGPLIVNGQIVAVCSTGDEADPGANTRAGSNYAVLSQSASWIRSTAGL